MATEQHLRQQLAAAYRLAALFGWEDTLYTHFSVRLPGDGEPRFLINPFGMMFDEVTASNLIVVDMQGKVVAGDAPANSAGFTIHSAVHMAREDAHCVIHTHTLPGMAVAACEDGLLQLNQISTEFYQRVGYHPYEGVAFDLDERARIQRSLGNNIAMILQSHGLLSVGRTVADAFYIMYYLNRACEIPLCRVIDEDFRHGMFEYALWSVLWFQRHFDRALAHQQTQTWKLYPQRAAADFHIGIMGLGEIGGYIADQLARLGYRVSGWSRSEKQLAGVTCYRGEEALDHFLGSLDGLINLLPLTAQTRGILAAPLFSRLPAGAVLINCGRGEHMVNEDVLAALESGQLAGAVLDVFPQEPLPADDPLWRHPQVVITPHMASAASAEVIARQLLENIQRQRRGLPLKNLVNKHAGY